MREKLNRKKVCKPTAKEKMTRRVISLMLVFAMVLFNSLPALNPSVQVSATCSSGIKDNGLGGISIDVNGSIYTNSGWGNTGGAPYGQGGCTWFAGARVRELTGKINYICWGPEKWLSNAKSQGFSTGTTYPSGKAVIVYSTHVAVLEKTVGDTAYISEGGSTWYSDAAHGYTVIRTISKSSITNSSAFDGTFQGFVYLGDVKWWELLTPANPGTDFYANLGMSYQSEFKSVGVNAANNYNVGYVGDPPATDEEKIQNDKYKSRYWHYVRNSDGSYTISNCMYTGYYLTAEGTSADSNVKVVNGYNGDAKQKWFIYGRWSGEYILRNAASDYVLWYNPNCNLQLKAKNDSNASNENVMIYEFDPISGSTTLTVNATTANNDTVFRWTKPTGNVAWYNVQIRRIDSSENVLEIFDQMNMLADNTQTNFSRNVRLPAGNYTAIAYPHSWVNYVASKRLYFTVNDAAPACSHSDTELRGKVEASCTKEGYSGDRYCKDCDKKISTGSVVPAKGHKWSRQYTVDKKATYASAGSKSIHCSVCGEVKPGSSVSIPRLKVTTPTVSKSKVIKKGFNVKWKKVSVATGYEVQYALNKKFTKSRKTVKINKMATISKKVTKLKAKKKYYVRVRAYKTVKGKKYYSAWSKVKTVQTKK